MHNYKQPNVGDESLANQLSFNYVAQTGQGSAGGKKQVESFKICEKLAPKKSRTKYTKDHVSGLYMNEEKQFAKVCLVNPNFI